MASTSERAKTMYPSSVNNCDRYKKEIEDLELLARNPNVGSRVWEGTFVKSVYGEAVVDNTKRKKKKDVPEVIVPKYVRVWAGEKDRFFVKEKGGHIPFTTRPPTPQPEPPPPPVPPVEEVVLTETLKKCPKRLQKHQRVRKSNGKSGRKNPSNQNQLRSLLRGRTRWIKTMRIKKYFNIIVKRNSKYTKQSCPHIPNNQ
ncbi:hypothetical protein BCR33DRAFT_744477 [Rhizoclosmatium globosum]|uniref:Uncharacterized protein n=1 Tax=Rhizoclosmatium globosum TaxID=329046 RepID=A0A1Y2B9J6_9FUNG|nr:hypothetical protein BCR33DRAFT_744477 [Rhizoclosmatium globosum]|eukprot:ORY31518.1 hypothetical protein BCR33DRAFT_744477 [Rhizoclosmatium globosum]